MSVTRALSLFVSRDRKARCACHLYYFGSCGGIAAFILVLLRSMGLWCFSLLGREVICAQADTLVVVSCICEVITH